MAMKFFRPLTALLPLALLAPACTGAPAGTASPYPKKIVAMPEGSESGPPLFNQNDTESESYLQMPKIALAYDETLVQVLTTNLDADEANEQVIVAKTAGREDAPLKLIVADYDGAQGRYVRSWETAIGALDERTIRVAAKDIIGNHTFQIIASGMTRDNRASLSAFRIVSQASGRLAYAPIFQLESEVSVEVEESDRGVGYSEGYSMGASFPIIVFSRDPASTDVSSIVRDTYGYSWSTLTYVLQRHETIQVEKAATEKLAGLLQSSSPELLTNYIQGIWYKSDEGGKNDEKILAINTEAGEIAFYSKDVQEVYNWKYSRRSLYNTLHIYTESELLKAVQPNITATLDSPTELTISITEYSTMEQWLNEQWGGTYVKLNQAQAAARELSAGVQAGRPSSFLQGEYVSPTGVHLTFADPAFTWKEGGQTETGGYSVSPFKDGETAVYLLSLKFMADQGLVIKDKFFTVDFTPEPKNGSPAQAFTLKPVQTTVYGIVTLKDQPLSFARQSR
jgi:hypothetical protein